MSLRLIEISLPLEQREHARGILKEHGINFLWHEGLFDDHLLIKVVLPAEQTELILDVMTKNYSAHEKFRVILLPVQAAIPHQEKEDEEQNDKKRKDSKAVYRVSRDELYHCALDGAELNRIFLIMVILSSIVASIGLIKGNIAAIIGAMVIAPLLGPNVALSLATTLGDTELAVKALKVNFTGLIISLCLSVSLGFFFKVDPQAPEILSRYSVGLEDIVLAFSAGCAGALAFTTGVSAVLIGVMVAVALLPPLVTFGLLLGSGHFVMAWGAFFLLLTNVICINLAGVLTFLAQGIRPRTWWEKGKAEKATRLAIFIWVALLILLCVAVIFSKQKQIAFNILSQLGWY